MTLSQHQIEAHATRALQEILAGRTPSPEDLTPLTGEVKECITALASALESGGAEAARKAFIALSHDRLWLRQLAAQAPPEAEAEKPTRRFRFLDDEEFENRPQREWLIPKIIPRSGLVLVYGLPRCGKSFLTIAWSLCIASGTAWLGRSVIRGRVAYIAAEGGAGLGPRMRAWKLHHGYQGNSGVRWLDQALILNDPGQFSELRAALTEDFPDPPVMIVIDTLSRCSGGADEDKASEIAKFLAAADILQQELQCAVLIVHHEGKDSGRGPRGSSALMGNTETVIGVARTDEGCLVSCAKQKDSKEFVPISLKMEVVRYGPYEEDDSVVLIVGSETAQPLQPDSQATILACLTGKQLTYTTLRDACVKAGQNPNTFKDAFAALHKADKIVKVDKCWQVNHVQQGALEGTEGPESRTTEWVG